MKLSFVKPNLPTRGAVVIGVFDKRKLAPSAARLDKQVSGMVTRAMKASRFEGKKCQTLELAAPSGIELGRIVLLGLGEEKALDDLAAQDLGGTVVTFLNRVGEATATVLLDDFVAADQFAYGARLRTYRFDKYRTQEKPKNKPTLKSLSIGCGNASKARRSFGALDRVADGVFMTRDLVSEPANVIYPETLAKAARTLTGLGVKVEVLDEKQMGRLGMNALLGVAQGSARPPRLVVMQWQGVAKSKKSKPIAFVGKGVTFDTGGISLKPPAGMEEMKWDMGGAGVVIGLMKALAGRKAKVNAIGVVGLVENMPSGSAQRPGDIVASMSGQTIEVLNTDAEGRLVLADALWYTQDRFHPRLMIDLATLTGAIIISLGSEHAGLMSNNDEIAERLSNAGSKTGEKVWRLPLHNNYDKLINTDAADVKNIGNREAGSITAAQFLQRFVNDLPWAHLDIAGVTWSKKDSPTVPKGGTGFGVRLLDRFVAESYEVR
ncbi:MAG: leucyl aminopeptidase [Alphaproteobacteria bacterium]|nr:leucyl aminopeptidase [Alphaproteobacteria bacterium]